MKIHVYIGLLQSGKTTTAKEDQEIHTGEKRDVSFADAVRECAWNILDWRPINHQSYENFKKTHVITLSNKQGEIVSLTGREFLQRLGTDAIRKFDENFWIIQLLKKISHLRMNEDVDHVYITDCRFWNEARSLKERFGEDVEFIYCDWQGQGVFDGHESEVFANEFKKKGMKHREIIEI